MGRNRQWAAVAIASAAVLLAACSGDKGNEAPGQATGEDGSVQEKVYPPAELVFYSTNGDTEAVFNEKYGNAIRAKFPQHTIRFIPHGNATRYPDLLASGQTIDVIFESINQFISGPLQYETARDMEPLLHKHGVELTRLEQTSLDAMKSMTGGKLYGVPVYTNSLALYYNKDLFDKFGVPYLRDGMTWGEVFQHNVRLTRADQGVQYAGLAFAPAHHFRMNSLSLPYVTAQGKSAVGENLDKWKALYETIALKPLEAPGYRERVMASGLPSQNHFIKDQNVAMYAALTNVPVTQDMSGMNWEVVKYPTYEEAPGVGPQLYPSYFGVSSLSKNPDQAMEVIHFLLSDEFQSDWARKGNMPAVHSKELIATFAEDTYFKTKNVKNAFFVPYAPTAVKTTEDSLVEGQLTKHLKNLALGEIDLNTMLRTIQEASDAILEEARKR